MSVYAFCGQPIAVPRSEYLSESNRLPPCCECEGALDRAETRIGRTTRRMAGLFDAE